MQTVYPSGTVSFDMQYKDDTGALAYIGLDQTFVVLVDGQGDVQGTLSGSSTPAIANVSGTEGAYEVQNHPLGGTCGTGALAVRWYCLGSSGGTTSPFPYFEQIANVALAPTSGYCTLTDLSQYGLGGATNYYDTDDDGNGFIQQAWNFINSRLQALLPDVAVPVATNSAGVHEEFLIACNAYYTNFYLAQRRHRGEYNELPDWIQEFRIAGEGLLDAIGSRNLVFEEQTNRVESGIGPAVAGTNNQGAAVFHSDRYGYVDVYRGADYEKAYVVKIDSEGSDRDIGDSTFKWSPDNGVTWSHTGIACGIDWIALEDGVHIRFERVGGKTDQVYADDLWYFNCVPLRKAVAGQPFAARSPRMRRG